MRKALFEKSDAGQWTPRAVHIPFVPYEEYTKILAEGFKFKRKDGIVEIKMHTNGGPMSWDGLHHRGIWQMCCYVGQDRDNEIVILGGEGDQFTASITGGDGKVTTREEAKANGGQAKDESAGFMDLHPLYEWCYYDGCNEIEGLVNDLEQPSIGIMNGPGFHTDIVLFCDITLAAEHAWTSDMHFQVNMVPGDGIQIAWRELLGRKRFAYAEYTGQILTAKKMLEYGMVNEVIPLEKIYDRAWEIAELMMASASSATRRVTAQVLRGPWKEDLAKELRPNFGTEMWITAAEHSPHDNMFWICKTIEAEAAMEDERNGLVTYPKLGEIEL